MKPTADVSYRSKKRPTAFLTEMEDPALMINDLLRCRPPPPPLLLPLFLLLVLEYLLPVKCIIKSDAGAT